MKKLLFLMLLLAAALPRAEADTTVTDEVFIKDGIMYHVLPDNTLEVVNGTGVNYEGDIVIPSHVSYRSDRLPVTRIGKDAFYQNKNIRTVTFPNTLKKLEQAFIGSSIQRVSIPASVDTIAYQCFMECFSLKEFILEDSPRPVYMNLMQQMDSLEYIYKGRDVLLMGPKEWSPFCSKLSLKRLDISDYVTKITNNEFSNCHNLRKIKIPNSVKVIEEDAFKYCYAVEEVDLGNSVDSIGVRALFTDEWVPKIKPKKLVLPGSLRQVDRLGLCIGYIDTLIIEHSDKPLKLHSEAMRCLDSIKYVELNRDVVDGFRSFLPSWQYKTTIKIGEGVTRIPEQAFQPKSTAGKMVEQDHYVTLPSSIRVIGGYAFNYSPHIKDLIIPALVDSIGYRAFEESKIETLKFESQYIDSISTEIFTNCSNLRTIDFSSSKLKGLGRRAFFKWYDGMKSLKTVIFNEGFEHIGDEAFKDCSYLENVRLPESIKYIGKNAFYGCKKAFENSTVHFPENIEYLGYSPCANVTDVTFCSDKPLTVNGGFGNLNSIVLPLNCNAYDFKLNKNGHAYCLLSEPVLDLNLSATYSPAYLHVPAGSADKYNAKYSLKNITIVDDLVAEGPRGVTADGQLVVTVECQPFAEGAELKLYADEEKTVEVGRAVAMASGDSRAGRLLTFRLDGLTTYDELHYRLSPLDDKGVKIALTSGTIKVNDPSAIDGIEADADAATAPDAVYDLQGRRLSAPQRGAVNIVNGRKVLVR